MTAAFAILLSLAATDVLTTLEERLDKGFDDATYRRYLYYCRQQDEGARLAAASERWLESNPDREVLRFGRAEGFLMSGSEREGLAAFRELYRSAPVWSSEIIFTLGELESDELPWFIEEERKRTANPALYAHMLVDFYLANDNPRKALAELSRALKSGEDAQSYRQEIASLSGLLGSERVLSQLKDASASLRFQLALEAGDEREMEEAIRSSKNPSELSSMGELARKTGYLPQALLAFEKSNDRASQVGVLAAMGRTEEARRLLSEDNSIEGQEQLAVLLSGSKQTYREALKTFNEMEHRHGTHSNWSTRAAALELLLGEVTTARQRLDGLPQDSAVLLLDAVTCAVQGEPDSIKRLTDISMLRFAGNDYENDLLLLYEISLTTGSGTGEYALALAAYRWGDATDAYERSTKLARQDTALADEALLLAAESLVRLGRWAEADGAYRKIYEDWPKSPLTLRAKFERALLLRDHLDARDEAKRIWEDIIRTSPTSLYADFARREL